MYGLVRSQASALKFEFLPQMTGYCVNPMLERRIYCSGGVHGQHKAEKRGSKEYQESGGRSPQEKNNRAPSQVGEDCPREAGCEGSPPEAQDLELKNVIDKIEALSANHLLELKSILRRKRRLVIVEIHKDVLELPSPIFNFLRPTAQR